MTTKLWPQRITVKVPKSFCFLFCLLEHFHSLVEMRCINMYVLILWNFNRFHERLTKHILFSFSSEKSIGKFCSGKTSSATPFNMYSYDGYAKIKFHSDSSVAASGFRLKFHLRDPQIDYLGYYDFCR